MKFQQLLAVCLALLAGGTADRCFAQSTINQNESVADGNTPQVSGGGVPTVALAPPASLGKTHEQVMHEQTDFKNSDQAMRMSALYRGSK